MDVHQKLTRYDDEWSQFFQLKMRVDEKWCADKMYNQFNMHMGNIGLTSASENFAYKGQQLVDMTQTHACK